MHTTFGPKAVLLAVGSAAALILAAAPASAAPAVTGPAVAPAADSATLRMNPGPSTQSTTAAVDIFCFLDVSDPRGPQPGSTIQASAVVLCSDLVDFITVTVELYRGSTRVSRTQETVPFSVGWGVTTTAGCVSGQYTAIAEGVVVAPPGFFPPVVSAVVGSATVNINCGGGPPPPGTQLPFGSFDLVEPTPDLVFRIAGWAIDPDTTGPIQISAWFCQPIGCTIGSPAGVTASFIANKPRPDVGAAYPQFGPNHGFDTQVFPFYWEDLAPGAYDLCVDARNAGGGPTTRLGCKPVTITPAMLGQG